jgi:hypothetical protein
MPPIEYLRLLRAVVECLRGNGLPPRPQTALEITEWLHNVQLSDLHDAMRLASPQENSKESLLRDVIDCILQRTHDERVPDWTSSQIAFWFSRVLPGDVEQALAMQYRHSDAA